MASARVLPMPTRTSHEPDMPPCRRSWGHDCDHAIGRPGPHVCWTWTGWPHICRCMRCTSQDGGTR